MCKKEKDLGMYRELLDDILEKYGVIEYSRERFRYLLTLSISDIVGMYRYLYNQCCDKGSYIYIFNDLKDIMAYEFEKTF